MPLITRNQVYVWFKSGLEYIPETIIQMVFKNLSDDQLASEYGLNVLRPGYFY